MCRCFPLSAPCLQPGAVDGKQHQHQQPVEAASDETGLNVVVVYHVTIVAIGHGLLKKFWPLVLGCVLRTAGRLNQGINRLDMKLI